VGNQTLNSLNVPTPEGLAEENLDLRKIQKDPLEKEPTELLPQAAGRQSTSIELPESLLKTLGARICNDLPSFEEFPWGNLVEELRTSDQELARAKRGLDGGLQALGSCTENSPRLAMPKGPMDEVEGTFRDVFQAGNKLVGLIIAWSSRKHIDRFG